MACHSYILGELCNGPTPHRRARMRAVDVVFSTWDGAITHHQVWHALAPMRKLLAKARRKREENLRAAAIMATRR